MTINKLKLKNFLLSNFRSASESQKSLSEINLAYLNELKKIKIDF